MYCQVCGSRSIQTRVERRFARVEHGKKVPYQEAVFECLDCGEQFSSGREANEAVAESEFDAVSLLVSWLRAKIPLNDMGIENALHLPEGQLRLWETRGPTPGSYALLRMLNAFPDLLAWLDAKPTVIEVEKEDVIV